MRRPPPRSTRTYTLFPYTRLFRASHDAARQVIVTPRYLRQEEAMDTHVSPRRGNKLLRADRAYRSGGGLAWLLARAPAGVFHRMLDRIDAGLALGPIEGHLPDGGIRLPGGRGQGPSSGERPLGEGCGRT